MSSGRKLALPWRKIALSMVSEIAPLLIVIRLEEFDYSGAAAIGILMLGLSFLMLLAINWLQRWSRSWQQ